MIREVVTLALTKLPDNKAPKDRPQVIDQPTKNIICFINDEHSPQQQS